MSTQSLYLVFSPSFGEPLLSIGFSSDRPFSLPSDPSASHIREVLGEVTQGSRKKQKSLRDQGQSYRCATTIDMLSDDVLFEIFDSYRKISFSSFKVGWPWHLLVHVCQRWRQVIFTSPQCLNLQLRCTFGTPVRKNLGIWPPFPILVDYHSDFWPKTRHTPNDEDNVIAALEHHNRICYVDLDLTTSQLGRMVAAMQEPFPVLKYLHMSHNFLEGGNTVLPAEFLGGCAPCLQEVSLFDIPYPALPSLLLSATHLVTLSLRYIPPTGFISPETLVVGLAALPRLERFTLTFQSNAPSPDRTPLPLAARTDLPSLTSFEFEGTGEYLENLVARIDSPQLDRILITYLWQPDNFQIYELPKFISRSVGPHLALFKYAEVALYKDRQLTAFDMYPRYPSFRLNPARMRVSCEAFGPRVSPLAQVLSQFSAALSKVVHLKLVTRPVPRLSLRPDSTPQHERPSYHTWTYDFEWQPLFHQFITAETLYVSRDLAERIASALEYSVSEETAAADALPSLHLICLAYQPASSIEKFVTARRLSGRPVSVINSEWDFEKRLESYGSE